MNPIKLYLCTVKVSPLFSINVNNTFNFRFQLYGNGFFLTTTGAIVTALVFIFVLIRFSYIADSKDEFQFTALRLYS